MTEDIWATLVNQARLSAPCAADEHDCHIRVVVGPLYAMMVHTRVGREPHGCTFCPPGDPRYIISLDTLQTVKRELLVARVARWLAHSHSDDQPESELRAA